MVYKGEIPMIEESVKYGTIKEDTTSGGIVSVYKNGNEAKLSIDLPPLLGPVTIQ